MRSESIWIIPAVAARSRSWSTSSGRSAAAVTNGIVGCDNAATARRTSRVRRGSRVSRASIVTLRLDGIVRLVPCPSATSSAMRPRAISSANSGLPPDASCSRRVRENGRLVPNLDRKTWCSEPRLRKRREQDFQVPPQQIPQCGEREPALPLARTALEHLAGLRSRLRNRPGQDGALADAGLALEQQGSRTACYGTDEASHSRELMVPPEDLFGHAHLVKRLPTNLTPRQAIQSVSGPLYAPGQGSNSNSGLVGSWPRPLPAHQSRLTSTRQPVGCSGSGGTRCPGRTCA